jgi:hypothetical protein
LEHFARSPVVQQIKHLGCIESLALKCTAR